MKKYLLIIFLFTSLNVFAQPVISWNMTAPVSGNMYGNFHPRIALDAAGNPLVIWGRFSDQSVFFSRWNGTMFTVPVKLNPTWLTIATASWMGPDIASHGDTIYVVVKRTPEAADTNYTYMIRSFDGGLTFLPPVRMDYIADSISRFPTVTTDASGNPVVGFMKFNASFLDSRWVVTKSTDYGNTFSTDVKASGWPGTSEVCDCCPGAILSNNTHAVMLYRNNQVNIRDTWAGVSNDNGNSFTAGMNVDNNNWMVPTCPASGPDGVIIGDTLYSVFMSGAGGSYRNYLSRSAISTVNFSYITPVTGAIAGLSQQNYPRIASSGNALGVVWKQNVSGVSQLPILFTTDVNSNPFVYDTVDLGNITNTDIAISNGKIHVIWQDDNTGTVNYRSGIFNPVTSGLSESEDNFTVYPNPVVNGYLTIHANEFNNRKAGYIISDGLNREILQSTVEAAGNKVHIDVAHLPQGMYFLQLNFSDKIYTCKFIK